MARDVEPSFREGRLPLTNPWPLLAAAFGAAFAALLIQGMADSWGAVLGSLVAASVVMALGAVGIRLRAAREEVENRFTTAAIIALASVVPFLGTYSLRPDWDSAKMLLGVLVGVGLACAFLLLMPRLVRRLLLILLVLVHFGGILCAVGSPAPPNGQPSWLINQLWVGVYRPYLYFMYLNNAYHFYSPDPGPPMLLWFRIEYENGKSRWVEQPDPEDTKIKLAFQRRLALTESANQLKQQPPLDLEQRLQRRREAGMNFRAGRIPMLDPSGMPRDFEFKEPIAYSKQVLRSYARYTARHYPCPDDPTAKVRTIKIYRVVHMIPSQSQIAEGYDPFTPTNYLPYYQGEFDAQGHHLDGPKFEIQNNELRMVDPGSPFLYWVVPIRLELKEGVPPIRFDAQGKIVPHDPSDFKIVDYMKIHAGDANKPSFWEEK